MTDFIHSYPMSSCDCYKCAQKNYTFSNKGVPTNMSVRDCDFSDYYDCNPKRLFKYQIEPKCNPINKITTLNPDIFNNKFIDPTFTKINPKDCPNDVCATEGYTSMDPRLLNAAGPSRLVLDRPPMNSTPKLNTLTCDSSLDKYGQNYKSYKDVNAGQIIYYIDSSREDAFYEPLFNIKAHTIGTMYQDPMGNMKPQYDRIIYKDCNGQKDGCEYDGCLSYLEDSQFHREDLLARQMRKRNQERYEPRWTNTFS